MKTKRLTKCSMEYMSILFLIWQVVDYYAVLFHVDAGENPTTTISKLLEKDGISYVRLSFPKTEYVSYGCKLVQKMKRVYNEYLRYCLLPDQKLLKPFSAGSSIHDIMESLYVDLVYEDDTYINMDIVYIDNLEAYNYVRADESKPVLIDETTSKEDDDLWDF